MGNCQAIEAASLVIQYPNGKTERMYWSINASEVMKVNPGHYVSMVIPVDSDGEREIKGVTFTRVKLLRSSESLVLGRVYRLVKRDEVMKILKEKNYEKMRRSQRCSDNESRLEKEPSSIPEPEKINAEKNSQSMRHERYEQRLLQLQAKFARSKSWCPSLQSISEGGSFK